MDTRFVKELTTAFRVRDMEEVDRMLDTLPVLDRDDELDHVLCEAIAAKIEDRREDKIDCLRVLTNAIACALLFFVISITTADAAGVMWKKVGNWFVMVDRSVGDGCFTVTSYDKHTVYLRVGFNPNLKTNYFVILNEDWTNIEVGRTYNIEAQFDRGEIWYAQAIGDRMNGAPMLMTWFDDPEWFGEFARGHKIAVRVDGKSVQLPLTGSRAALEEMLACQEAFLPPRSDEFKLHPSASDPVA